MITPEQIEKKASNAFRSFLRAWLTGEPFFPLEFPVGMLPMQDYDALNQGTQTLIAASKAKRGSGYTIQFQTRRTQRYGPQDFPRTIVIGNEEDYLALIKRKAKFQRFQEDVGRIRAVFPELETWLYQHPIAVLKFAGEWDSLLAVCRYLLEHPASNLYVRELPLPLHTKFVEQHTHILRSLLDTLLPVEQINVNETHFARRYGLRYDEPLIRMRLLDPESDFARSLPFHDMSIPFSEVARWSPAVRHCLVVENKLTFLTLPPLPATLAMWGGGFRVELLRHLTWLETCTLFYWGDLDAYGFQILARLRRHHSQAQSLLMERSTFDTFKDFVVEGSPTSVIDLPLLTEAELSVYEHLRTENLRLEQEHIPLTYTTVILRNYIH